MFFIDIASPLRVVRHKMPPATFDISKSARAVASSPSVNKASEMRRYRRFCNLEFFFAITNCREDAQDALNLQSRYSFDQQI